MTTSVILLLQPDHNGYILSSDSDTNTHATVNNMTTDPKHIASQATEILSLDSTRVEYFERSVGGTAPYTSKGYKVIVTGLGHEAEIHLSLSASASAEEVASEARSQIEHLHPAGTLIATRLTEESEMKGAKVDFKGFGHGQGFSVVAGQAMWGLAGRDATYAEVKQALENFMIHQGESVAHYASPSTSKGSLGQDWFDERG